ncbi:MAG: aminoacyl-tRNA hydrolase [Candidatus Colwellbacteria bacterium]|nr:aminoacyl-tRNA hydrolase [Candidatus Colwellbacteria bacterium]
MEIKLAIGLGNPGPEYRNTYHNVGRLFIDHLASERANFKRRSSFEYFQLTNLLTLVKPLTFMNQSGGATLNARKYFNSKPREILVVHDDSDLPLGSFKLSFGRGSAGHQGIESVIKSLKTNKFYRLRIGVRPTKALPAGRQARRVKASELVLKKIPAGERRILQNLFGKLGVLYFETDGKRHLAFNPGHDSRKG